MHLNQAVQRDDPRVVSARCQHARGETATAEMCAHLRALDRLRS